MDPLWSKLNTTMDREYGDCDLDVAFASAMYVREFPHWIEIKLHFISFMNHLYCKGDELLEKFWHMPHP